MHAVHEPEIFLSYARIDEDRVDALMAALRDAGIHVWRDTEMIDVGDPFRADITHAIRAADALVLTVSGNSIQSIEVLSEAEFAREERKPILPVYLEKLQDPLPDRFRPLLTGQDHVELYKDFDGGVAKLVRTVRGRSADREPATDSRTSFASLQSMDTEAVEYLAHEYESRLASGKSDAQTLVALGQCYLHLGRYQEAHDRLRRAMKSDADTPAAAYSLALSIIAGRRPRALTMREAEGIARLLDRATRLDPDAGHLDYLAAIVKVDYYEGHGLLVPPPSVGTLRARARSKALDEAELARVFDAVDVDDGVWQDVYAG